MNGIAGRRRAWQFGRWGEAVSAGLLRLKGYQILARGYRAGVGEIDLVARRGRLVAFVEVKARQAPAGEVLSARQQQRIMRAAGAFMAAHPHLASCDQRFDLVLVTRWGLPRHCPDAWRPAS
ncbi:MAG: YraN family protein [Rhodospirillales bacterium]|nr:MAG: YraN family protein [Rhodospirillales bacterium]